MICDFSFFVLSHFKLNSALLNSFSSARGNDHSLSVLWSEFSIKTEIPILLHSIILSILVYFQVLCMLKFVRKNPHWKHMPGQHFHFNSIYFCHYTGHTRNLDQNGVMPGAGEKTWLRNLRKNDIAYLQNSKILSYRYICFPVRSSNPVKCSRNQGATNTKNFSFFARSFSPHLPFLLLFHEVLSHIGFYAVAQLDDAFCVFTHLVINFSPFKRRDFFVDARTSGPTNDVCA